MNVVSIVLIFLTGLIMGWMLSAVSTSNPPGLVSAKELEVILRAYDGDRHRQVENEHFSDVVSKAKPVERDI